jgi:L-ribulose-5-phosphate 3-epimerase
MSRISLNGSSFVGKQAGYKADWDASVDAVNAYYSPEATFGQRFEQMLLDTRALGFDALDIWTAGQLSWRWASPSQISTARQLLDKHKITITSLGDGFGETRDEFLAACKLAVGVNTKLLSGGCPIFKTDRQYVIDMLNEYDLYLGLENHPEHSAQEMLDQIGDGANGRVGTTIDTGWYATQAPDVVEAVKALARQVFQIHLKDVLAGAADQNVGYGQGVAPLEESVKALKSAGYDGLYSVEIHSVNHDPSSELVEGLALVKKWVGK